MRAARSLRAARVFVGQARSRFARIGVQRQREVLRDRFAQIDSAAFDGGAEGEGVHEVLFEQPRTGEPGDQRGPAEPEERARRGISDALLRLSIGLEDAEDLIADLEQAFARSGD